MNKFAFLETDRLKAISFICSLALISAVFGISALVWAGDSVAGGKQTAVAVQLFNFKPKDIEVEAGTQVVWTNNDSILHTVTAGSPEKRGSEFNSNLDGKGSTFSFTFDQPGTYEYFCDRHQHMRGKIRVK